MNLLPSFGMIGGSLNALSSSSSSSTVGINAKEMLKNMMISSPYLNQDSLLSLMKNTPSPSTMLAKESTGNQIPDNISSQESINIDLKELKVDIPNKTTPTDPFESRHILQEAKTKKLGRKK